MRALEHVDVICNPAYTYKFQLKTTQVGRRMASNVREIFKEHILEEISQFSKLVKYFKIPEDFSICGINLYSPVVIIMVGLLFRVGIYMYDMHSDVKVIQ